MVIKIGDSKGGKGAGRKPTFVIKVKSVHHVELPLKNFLSGFSFDPEDLAEPVIETEKDLEGFLYKAAERETFCKDVKDLLRECEMTYAEKNEDVDIEVSLVEMML